MKKSDPALINLETYWPYQVVVLADIVSRHTRDILKKHTGLNLSQWRVLAAIGEQPGRTSVDVVAITPMDKGIVSRAVATLIDAGLAEKIPDTSDRRRASLKLTADGYKDYKIVANALQTTMQDISTEIVKGHDFSSVLKHYIDQMSAE